MSFSPDPAPEVTSRVGVVRMPSTHWTAIGQSRPCDASQPITAQCEELKAHPKHGGGGRGDVKTNSDDVTS